MQKGTTLPTVETRAQPPWPRLSDRALYGIAGQYVRKIEPQTEADRVGILMQFLVMLGNLIGRGPHFRVEADSHFLNLFCVLVGESSKGRKGVSAGQAKRLLKSVDPDWCDLRIQGGLSSGEGLIHAVRDPIEKSQPIREHGRLTGELETTIVDPGETDKRLLVLEPEFASALTVMHREGNILSGIIRNAWDSGQLRTLTKNSPVKATGAHIAIVGHITISELLRKLDSTEAANGFANRFLWVCVRRSKFLPEGGAADSIDFSPEIEALHESVEFARQTGLVVRDQEAREIWANVYPELSAGKPGLLGSMIGRSEAQTMRLACLYAVLDRSAVVRADHLLAALALWSYCEESASWIFRDALGDPVADGILRALRNSHEGLTRTEIGDLFGRHCRKAELGRALGSLLERGFATPAKERTGGRSGERWHATDSGCEKSE